MYVLLSTFLQHLQRIFDDENFNKFSFCLSFILILAAIIRASTTGLVYDEAFTYISYANPDNFWRGHQLLNNHWLNTFLIFIVDFLSGERYNDFIIRLPNIISYVFYCYGAYLIAFKFKYRYLIFSLFILNYYLFIYSYVARGYCIAATCILYSCYFYMVFQEKKTTKAFNYFILFSCLSVLANGVCIYITIALIISLCFSVSYSDLLKNHKIPILLYCIVSLFIGCFIFYVSRDGYPIYSGGYISFILGIAETILPVNIFSVFFSVCIFLIFINSVIFLKKPLFTYAYVIYLILAILGNFLTRRGFPICRELLPVYPLVICSIAYGIQNLKISKQISSFCIFFLMAIFSVQVFITDADARRGIGRTGKENVHSYIFNLLQENKNDDMTSFIKRIQKSPEPSDIYYFQKYKYLKNKYHKE